jgi:hypothetical protein
VELEINKIYLKNQRKLIFTKKSVYLKNVLKAHYATEKDIFLLLKKMCGVVISRLMSHLPLNVATVAKCRAVI